MRSKSIYHMFQTQVAKYGDRTFLRHKINGHWVEISWNEMDSQVMKCALAITSLGVPPGKAVGILSESRVEWVITDMAIVANGCITTAAYSSSPAADTAYVLGHAEVQIVFVENKQQLIKILDNLQELPGLKKIVVYDTEGIKEDILVESFDNFLARGASAGEDIESKLNDRVTDLNSDTLLTYIYTSGTTGAPKGAMLTHGNAVYVAETSASMGLVNENDHLLSFLPLAHALERVVFYMAVKVGGTVTYAESLYKMAENLPEVRPTILIGVPRVYEKIHEKVMASVESGSAVKKALFKWAVSVGEQYSELHHHKKTIPPLLNLKNSIADRLVFSKIKKVTGGNIRWLGSGGAPLSEDVHRFFNAIGLQIIQAYGLTETTAPAILTMVDEVRIGRVGKRMPEVDCIIADDGEVLMRGPNVFKGYLKNPKATEECFVNGWFKSGDLGEFDEEGFLKITGRKKDLIITAGGKNITPQKLENLFSSIPLVSQAVIAGDGKKYLTAIFTINQEELQSFAAENGLSSEGGIPLDSHPEVRKRIEIELEEKNHELPKYEAVKKFTIIPHEFTVESGELTPTMKVKKNVVLKRYADIVDSMYK